MLDSGYRKTNQEASEFLGELICGRGDRHDSNHGDGKGRRRAETRVRETEPESRNLGKASCRRRGCPWTLRNPHVSTRQGELGKLQPGHRDGDRHSVCLSASTLLEQSEKQWLETELDDVGIQAKEHAGDIKKIFPEDLWELPFSTLPLTAMKRKQIALYEGEGRWASS